MKPTKPNSTDSLSVWDGDPEPDVWYGPEGIDALLWADPVPYADPLMGEAADELMPAQAGDPR